MTFANLIGNRPAGDLLSRVVRLTLGGREYVLPVLKSGPNARWQASLDEKFRQLLAGIQEAENDTGQITALLLGAQAEIKDALFAYDQTGVLPPREELDEQVDDIEYLLALLGVWQAANPLVGIGLAALMMGEAPMNGSSPPTNTPKSPTTGRRARSRKS